MLPLLISANLSTASLEPPPATASALSPAAVAAGEQLEKTAILRSGQLQLHQALAIGTLTAMALNAGLGFYTSNYAPDNQYGTVRTVHMWLGGVTSGLYLGAAGLALTAPHGYDLEPGGNAGGWDSVTIHRNLAYLHEATLASTVVLGILTGIGKVDPPVHGAVAWTTLGLMTLSAGVIALDF